MKMTDKIGFALSIYPRRYVKDKWEVASINKGVSEEVIITTIRNWLKATEENYYEEFKEGSKL